MHAHYKLKDYQFGNRIAVLRRKTGLTQAEVAVLVGISEKAIRNWEGGLHYPTEDNFQKLVEIYLFKHAFPRDQEQEEVEALWNLLEEHTSRHVAFDVRWFRRLLESRASVTRSAVRQADGSERMATLNLLRHREDWGGALNVPLFSGRENELAALKQCVLNEQCRVVAILGIGGIGKTALATQLARQVASDFQVVIWRSLRNAPVLEELLSDCLQLLAGQYSLSSVQTPDQLLMLLLEALQKDRCLLVLDNVETILQKGSFAGHYRQGYENYHTLFLQVGTNLHRSCLILTSREKLTELDMLMGMNAQVHILRLAGLAWAASQQLLENEGLFGTPQTWSELSERCSGNLLALKIVAEEVRELFGGDIAAFLLEGHMALQGIHQLLTQQFERLSALEQRILYWLAIERDLTSLEDLRVNMGGRVSRGELLEALSSLRRRSLIERGEQGAVFTLQSMVLEYMTERLVEQACGELRDSQPTVLLTHALLQAQAKDYIRNSQEQLILEEILNRLLIELRDKRCVKELLDQMLQVLRTLPMEEQGYGGGNLVNLLIRLNGHMKGEDFSHLTVWQADLRRGQTQDATFIGADLTHSAFLETINTISSVALSPNGQYIAGGGLNGGISLWRTANGQLLRTLVGHIRHIRALAFHPAGTLLASGDYDGQVKLWDVESGQCVHVLHGHTRWVKSVAFHPEGRFVATGSDDRSIRVWDSITGQCIKGWYELESEIWSVAFSPDGRWLASGAANGVVTVWNLTGEQYLWRQIGHHDLAVSSVAFHPEGELLASGGEDATITLWQIESGEPLCVLSGHTDKIQSVTFNTEGVLASSGFDSTIRLWQVGAQCTSAHAVSTLSEHNSHVWSIAFSSGDLLVSGSHDGCVKLWQISAKGEGGKCLRTLRGYARLVNVVAFSPDGSTLVSGESNGMVRIWEMERGQCLRTLAHQRNPLLAIAFSLDGQFLVHNSDQAIILLKADTGQCLRILQGHLGSIGTMIFSPDGRFLLSGSFDATIKQWEMSSGHCLQTLQGHRNWIWSLACSPDGTLLASGDVDGVIKLWKMSSGQCLRTLQGSPQAIVALRFTPDGQRLLSSNAQNLVAIWDMDSGDCLKTIPGIGESYWPGSVAFSADGNLLALASSDQTVKIWNVNESVMLHMLPCHEGQPRSVAFCADQQVLACGTNEGAIVLWETQTGEHLMTLQSERPYERMKISGVTGITEAQKALLKTLGAIEENADMEHK